MSNVEATLRKIESFCIGLFSIVMISSITPNNLERKGIIYLILPHLIPSWRKVRLGIPGRSLEGRNWSRSWWKVVTTFLPMTCSAYFPTLPRVTCLWFPLLSVYWNLPQLSGIDKCSLTLAYEYSDRRIFSIDVPHSR